MSYVSVWDGSKWHPPVVDNRDLVQLMMDTPGVTWAHRGGSLHWADCSEYAYDQAVAAGYKVLEFSTHRTSDGWFFGVHDDSLDRTSQTTGTGPISSMTRTQVESHMITNGAEGGPQPYYGLIDFLQKYNRDKVLVVDPKGTPIQFRQEFFDILDTYGDRNRIVVKWYGNNGGDTNPNGVLPLAVARGWRTWGYYFRADYNSGNLANTGSGPWTMIGMEYVADQVVWDLMNSFGKPTVAHIIPDQWGYDHGMGKGANMAQCSGVKNIAAVSW